MPDTVASRIDAAKSALKKKDATSTVRELESALALARADAPLEVRAAVVVHEAHTGLGLYTAASGDEVRGRDMRLYVEVANFAQLPTPAGASAVLEVEADFAYTEETGEMTPLGRVKLGTQQFSTRTPIGLTSFGLDVHMGAKSPAGVYAMKLFVTDANSKKTGTRDVRFVLK